MPAQLEEVVVDADLLDAQDLLPDRGDALLDLVARGDVVVEEARPRVQARLRAIARLGRVQRQVRLGPTLVWLAARPIRLDPVALALERVGRQRQALALLVGVERAPIDTRVGSRSTVAKMSRGPG